MLKIAVIILNWENAQATQACAHSVLEEMNRCIDSVQSQLWIVDNGSNDGSVAALRGWVNDVDDERVSFIGNPENLGFSGGMNKGIFAAAKADQFDYIWLLNNDIVVEPDSLSALARSALKEPAVAIWGSTVVDANSRRIQCAGGCGYNRWLGKESRVYAGMIAAEVPGLDIPKLDYIFGAAMLIRADVLARLDGLNEDYFLFYEELDLAEQLQQEGRLGWCKGSIVLHEGGGSSVTKAEKAFSAYHAALSAYKFTWRYYPVCLPTVVVSRVLGLAAYAVIRMNAGLALAPLRALRDFFRTELRA